LGNQLASHNIHILYNIVYTNHGGEDSCAMDIFLEIVRMAISKGGTPRASTEAKERLLKDKSLPLKPSLRRSMDPVME
jgi:hypothetical protein